MQTLRWQSDATAACSSHNHSAPCCVCSDIMSGARTARLNANLVLTGQAYTANLVTSYPSDKHACTALLYALPSAGVSLETMQGLLRAQLDGLVQQGPTAAELQRIKKVPGRTQLLKCKSVGLVDWLIAACGT